MTVEDNAFRSSRPLPEKYPNGNQVEHPIGFAQDVPGVPLEQPITATPSELTLLRDIPFVLQGVSTTNLVFQDDYTVDLPPTAPGPLIAQLNSLLEPGLLYRQLRTYTNASSDKGLFGQSFRSAIGSELRSYLGLVASIEGKIRSAIASANEDERQMGVIAQVTLRRCLLWVTDAVYGLRLMRFMLQDIEDKKGGRLISMVHHLSTQYGDPFIIKFAERLLAQITRPFYDMLRRWIYDGELSDPYHEFFVIEQDQSNLDQDPRKIAATSVWENKYIINDSMIPTIVTEDFAKKVFLIGKSLNFIRYGCADSAWVEDYSKEASKELHYGDTATLETSIDKAYKTTMARLIHLMDDKFKLFEHLNALKKYLLLGQGDFIALLMESLSSNLDRPAGSQYRHTLTAQLEHAIRGSNAQFDSPDVLRRLDARLLELSHGEIGWDVFTLEYKVDAPVDVVITSWANKQYLVVFNFLWRIKRVEFALESTWRRFMTGARGVLANVDETLGRDWKAARGCIAEMIHFINQLQNYILFEVIEASWDQLLSAIAKPDCTLDDLISAHTKYLTSITHKGLLGSTTSSITGRREDSFTAQLHQILKTMLAYKEVVEGLYSFSVAEFTRQQERAAKLETRSHTHNSKHAKVSAEEDGHKSPSAAEFTNKRAHDTNSSLPPPLFGGEGGAGREDQMLPSLRTRLKDLASDFKSKVEVLLGDLSTQPDTDMKFLGVVMNFNSVYKPRRRRRVLGAPGEKERDRRTPGQGINGAAGDGK